ncbi:MAG TPA: hypothetical protein VN033_12345 [Vulgatibacter sp.]|nr:hypothetical protein [Vulgatibacter sp.]
MDDGQTVAPPATIRQPTPEALGILLTAVSIGTKDMPSGLHRIALETLALLLEGAGLERSWTHVLASETSCGIARGGVLR